EEGFALHGGPPALFTLHEESVELVPVGVAEIAGVEASAAIAGRAFVTATISERDVVEPLHLRLVGSLERDHHAIADARRIAVKGLGEADPGAAARLAPGDELLVLHHSPDPQFSAQSVVEFRGLLAVVRAERHIADHHVLLSSRVENIKRTNAMRQNQNPSRNGEVAA